MSRYAQETSVSAEKSRAEIEATLGRYGADAFMYGWEGNAARVAFRLGGRHIQFNVEMPNREDFRSTPGGKRQRDDTATHKAWQQAQRQRWRALGLVIKAKLEAVESGISTYEEEFLAWTVLPDGSTVGQRLLPQIASSYENGKMPRLLLGMGSP